MNLNKMAVPAIIAGVIVGVISAVFQFFNLIIQFLPATGICLQPISLCLCCMLPIFGGFAAALLYSRGEKLDVPGGAFVGAFSGIIGGSLSSIAGALIKAILTITGFEIASSIGMESVLTPVAGSLLSGTILALFSLFAGIVFGTIFGGMGGLIFAVIKSPKNKKRKKTPEGE